MKKRVFLAVAAMAAAAAFTSCTEAPQPAPSKEPAAAKKEPPAPEGPVAAQTAFYEMYKPARAWAPDLLPLSLISGEVKGTANDGGKAAMWTAVFVSQSRREARTFVWAVGKGVSEAGAESWSGSTPKSRPFQITEFVVNSDAAYKTAAEKAAAWLKKHPGKTASLSLASTARLQVPVWYVMWGTPKSGYLAFVNATTGTPMTGR
jgi:hypothetical protein